MKVTMMICGLCNKELHPLDAHFGRINGLLDAFHIDCWNEHFAKEIEEEKAASNEPNCYNCKVTNNIDCGDCKGG